MGVGSVASAMSSSVSACTSRPPGAFWLSTARPAPRPRRRLAVDSLEDRTTPAVPYLVADVNATAAGSPVGPSPQNLTDVNGTLFFSAFDPQHGVELWKSDGTQAGTVLVKDINPTAGYYGGGGSSPATSW